MKFDYDCPTRMPLALKHGLLAMALFGWKDIPDGFVLDLTPEGAVPAQPEDIAWARQVFPKAVWEGAKMTVTGEPARDFMALYRRATKMPEESL